MGYNYVFSSKDSFDVKLDPTIINGGVINSPKSNAKLGKDFHKYYNDESDGSFKITNKLFNYYKY